MEIWSEWNRAYRAKKKGVIYSYRSSPKTFSIGQAGIDVGRTI